MKTNDGFQQCYNGQLAVDGEFQIIVANYQGNNPSDNGCLVPLLDEVKDTLGSEPQQCLADAGYRKEADLQALEMKGINGYVSLRREGKRTQTSTLRGIRRRPGWRRSLPQPRGEQFTLSANTWLRR